MSHERSLDVLLLDILDDFERLLKTAKNGPAKRRLAGRIERIKRAVALARNEQRLSSKAIDSSHRVGV